MPFARLRYILSLNGEEIFIHDRVYTALTCHHMNRVAHLPFRFFPSGRASLFALPLCRCSSRHVLLHVPAADAERCLFHMPAVFINEWLSASPATSYGIALLTPSSFTCRTALASKSECLLPPHAATPSLSATLIMACFLRTDGCRYNAMEEKMAYQQWSLKVSEDALRKVRLPLLAVATCPPPKRRQRRNIMLPAPSRRHSNNVTSPASRCRRFARRRIRPH